MTSFKRLPYGISDFRQIRREGLYFVDRAFCKGTYLHLIVAQIRGYDLVRLEEICSTEI